MLFSLQLRQSHVAGHGTSSMSTSLRYCTAKCSADELTYSSCLNHILFQNSAQKTGQRRGNIFF